MLRIFYEWGGDFEEFEQRYLFNLSENSIFMEELSGNFVDCFCIWLYQKYSIWVSKRICLALGLFHLQFLASQYFKILANLTVPLWALANHPKHWTDMFLYQLDAWLIFTRCRRFANLIQASQAIRLSLQFSHFKIWPRMKSIITAWLTILPATATATCLHDKMCETRARVHVNMETDRKSWKYLLNLKPVLVVCC